jgi:hypothetical protein
MKTSLKIALFLCLFGLAVMSVSPAFSQCAACAAAVKTNSNSGAVTANGLNKGILFLLAAPYLAAGIVGFVWYKKFRRKNVNLDIRNEKLHLN